MFTPLRLNFALMFFCFTGINAARLAITLFALDLGAQPAAVGILYATFFIFPLLVSWPIGILADRWGPRWPLVFGAACSALAMVMPYFFLNMPVLYLAGTLLGLGFAFYKVLLENLVGLLSRPHERARNYSNASMVGAITGFAGPLGAGLAIDHLGAGPASLYMMALYLIACVILLTVGNLLPAGTPATASPVSIRNTLTDRNVLRVLALTCFVQIGQDFHQYFLPVYCHSVSLSASAIGAVMACFSVASFGVRFVLPQFIARLGEESVLGYAFLIAAAGITFMAFSSTAVAIGAATFIVGLGLGCGQPITQMLMFSNSAKGRSGENFGLRQTITNVLRVTTPTMFGAIASALGYLTVFGLTAFLLASGGVMSRRASRNHG